MKDILTLISTLQGTDTIGIINSFIGDAAGAINNFIGTAAGATVVIIINTMISRKEDRKNNINSINNYILEISSYVDKIQSLQKDIAKQGFRQLFELDTNITGINLGNIHSIINSASLTYNLRSDLGSYRDTIKYINMASDLYGVVQDQESRFAKDHYLYKNNYIRLQNSIKEISKLLDNTDSRLRKVLLELLEEALKKFPKESFCKRVEPSIDLSLEN